MLIRISREPLEQARQIIVDARERCAEIDARKEALTPIDEVKDGLYAVENRQNEITAMEAEKQQIIDEGAEALTNLRQQMETSLDDQKYMKGDDLNSADYALLRDGLIETPDELNRLLGNNDNLAFARAARNYAAERNWEGFDSQHREFMVMAQVVRNFVNTWFNMADIAIRNLDGLMAMQIADENELNRMAQVHGVIQFME